jgi:hypothetical protein
LQRDEPLVLRVALDDLHVDAEAGTVCDDLGLEALVDQSLADGAASVLGDLVQQGDARGVVVGVRSEDDDCDDQAEDVHGQAGPPDHSPRTGRIRPTPTTSGDSRITHMLTNHTLRGSPYQNTAAADGGGLTAAGRERREVVRMQAAELFEQGIRPPEAAQHLRVSRKSAYQWHQL